eukprot:gene16000-18974_t
MVARLTVTEAVPSYFCFLLFVFDSGASALRVGFVADTGSGKSTSGQPYRDFWGNMQRIYDINCEPCLNYKGGYCRTPSAYARSVFKLMREKNVDLVVHAGDFDYESSPPTWHNFLKQELQGMGYLAAKGNRDSNCDEGAPDPSACKDDSVRNIWNGGLWDGMEGCRAYRLPLHQPDNAICTGKYGVDYSCP